jgi:hypothetical protein
LESFDRNIHWVQRGDQMSQVSFKKANEDEEQAENKEIK